MDESKKRTAMLTAKREFLVKAFSSDYFRKSDEDLKMIMFLLLIPCLVKLRLMKKGTGEESTWGRRCPNISEAENLVEKIDENGFGEVKTLTSDVPTLLDYKDFNYDSCSLIDCNFVAIHDKFTPCLWTK